MKDKILLVFKVLIITETVLSVISLLSLTIYPDITEEVFSVFSILTIPVFLLHIILKGIRKEEKIVQENEERIKKEKKKREEDKKDTPKYKSNRIFNEKNTIDNEEDLKKWRKDFFNEEKSKDKIKELSPELQLLGFKLSDKDIINKKTIKKNYLSLAKKYHPDKKYGNEEVMKKLNSAYKKALDNL